MENKSKDLKNKILKIVELNKGEQFTMQTVLDSLSIQEVNELSEIGDAMGENFYNEEVATVGLEIVEIIYEQETGGHLADLEEKELYEVINSFQVNSSLWANVLNGTIVVEGGDNSPLRILGECKKKFKISERGIKDVEAKFKNGKQNAR